MVRPVRCGRRICRQALVAAVAFMIAAPAVHASPTILLLHGGGWQTDDSSEMSGWSSDFQAHGYRTVFVEYPLGRVTRSIDYTAAVARRERVGGEPVIAYGMSAGGTIASALAAAGIVDGAVNIVGPTDFTRWDSAAGAAIMLAAKMSSAEKRSASPFWRLGRNAAPQLLQCGKLDVVTPWSQCTRFVARAVGFNPDTTLYGMLNSHSQWSGDRDRAREWVQARWPAVSTSAIRRSRPLRWP